MAAQQVTANGSGRDSSCSSRAGSSSSSGSRSRSRAGRSAGAGSWVCSSRAGIGAGGGGCDSGGGGSFAAVLRRCGEGRGALAVASQVWDMVAARYPIDKSLLEWSGSHDDKCYPLARKVNAFRRCKAAAAIRVALRTDVSLKSLLASAPSTSDWLATWSITSRYEFGGLPLHSEASFLDESLSNPDAVLPLAWRSERRRAIAVRPGDSPTEAGASRCIGLADGPAEVQPTVVPTTPTVAGAARRVPPRGRAPASVHRKAAGSSSCR